ncbi:hypothetical protein G6F42_022576 [Rhizopus arrhizus]|nr:hypothetical protein G6F42_022576 [Rhizopus arrhizus]
MTSSSIYSQNIRRYPNILGFRQGIDQIRVMNRYYAAHNTAGQEDVSGASKWLIYILVQLRFRSGVVAYGIAFLEMGFNSDERSSTESILENILSIVHTLTTV